MTTKKRSKERSIGGFERVLEHLIPSPRELAARPDAHACSGFEARNMAFLERTPYTAPTVLCVLSQWSSLLALAAALAACRFFHCPPVAVIPTAFPLVA